MYYTFWRKGLWHFYKSPFRIVTAIRNRRYMHKNPPQLPRFLSCMLKISWNMTSESTKLRHFPSWKVILPREKRKIKDKQYESWKFLSPQNFQEFPLASTSSPRYTVRNSPSWSREEQKGTIYTATNIWTSSHLSSYFSPFLFFFLLSPISFTITLYFILCTKASPNYSPEIYK